MDDIIQIIIIYKFNSDNINKLPIEIQNIQKVFIKIYMIIFPNNKYFINYLKYRCNDMNKIFLYLEKYKLNYLLENSNKYGITNLLFLDFKHF